MLSCNAVLPSVSLAIDGKWIVVNSADMVIDVSVAQDKSLCMVSFLPNSGSFWYLGQAFYREYYVVHDFDRQAMQFAPTEEAKKTKLELVGALPTAQFQLEYGYGKFLVRLSAVMVVACFTWVFIL